MRYLVVLDASSAAGLAFAAVTTRFSTAPRSTPATLTSYGPAALKVRIATAYCAKPKYTCPGPR